MDSRTPKTGGRKQRKRRKKGGRTTGDEKKIANRIFILPFVPPAAKMNFDGDLNWVKQIELRLKNKNCIKKCRNIISNSNFGDAACNSSGGAGAGAHTNRFQKSQN